jgi:transglutaminase-like putative cysteine protease
MSLQISEHPDDYLAAGPCIESDRPEIIELARKISAGAADQVETARRLFYWARDRLVYDAACPFWAEEHYRASAVVRAGRGFCIQKAVVLAALARAVGLPARLVFADLRNLRMSAQLRQLMGSDLFVYHCYNQIWLGGRWVKMVCSFDRELSLRHDYPPVEFDGINDALFAAFDQSGRPFMEYVCEHGPRFEVPLAEVLAAWRSVYGNRVDLWRQALENKQSDHE